MENSNRNLLHIVWEYKHYWIWPLVLALALFAALVLSKPEGAATPYIYNIH